MTEDGPKVVVGRVAAEVGDGLWRRARRRSLAAASVVALVVGGGAISVLDPAVAEADSVTATVTVGTYPYGVAVNPAGTYAYVVNYGSNTVSVVDTSTNTVASSITVPTGPFGVAVNPAGTFAYVDSNSLNTVSIINLSTNTIASAVTVGSGPAEIAINPAGTYAYVTNSSAGTVSVIDLSTNTVTATVTVGAGASGVAVNPAGTFAYVANSSTDTVSVINTATNAVTSTVTVGSGPTGIAINAAGTVAYTANNGAGTVSAIDLSTNAVTSTITVGSGPYGIAVNPAQPVAYVVNNGAGTVSEINLSTDTVAATVTVGSGPHGVAVNPAGTAAYVTNTSAGTVSVISISPQTPGVPAAPTAVGGNAQATVTVTAPGSGGTPTSYTVTAHDSTTPGNGGETCTVTGATGSCPVTGLTNGDSYTFTSTATDAGGTSGASPPSNAVIPEAPAPGTQAAPSAVAGNAEATVTVAAPGSGGTPSSYTVTAMDSTTPANGGQTCTVTGATGSCTLTGLTNGDSYTFTSTATDPGGTSAASPPSNAVIPEVGVAPNFIADSPPRATLDAPYSYTFTASGSPAPTFRLTAGRLPAGLAINAITGVLSGTPTGSGAFTFRVVATNRVGSVTSGLISITVPATTVGVPSAPRDVRATPNDGRVTLSFIAPVSDGGAKIDHYQVSVDGGRWRTGLVRHSHPLTAVITGLTDGHTYAIRLRAENIAGVSVTRTVTATPKTWVTDPLSAAVRKAEVAVPADPAAYRGPWTHTRATDRSYNGTIAVPLTSVHGRPLHGGQAAVLSGDGLFDFNQATLTKAGALQVREVVASLTGSKTVTCEGYTDYGGVASHQLALSIARANTVCDALVADGAHIATHAIGYGDARPVVIGGTRAQRASNRRVVIYIDN